MPVSCVVRAASRTALCAVAESEGFRVKAVVWTLTPMHFENGGWDTGGNCERTRLFRRIALGAIQAEFHVAP
jgi:hypothetical protein